jgi:hypothetical protein
MMHGGTIMDTLPHIPNHSWFPLWMHMGGMLSGLGPSFLVVHGKSLMVHMTMAQRFVVRSQILNLTLTPSFDHNSWKLGLNEQCERTLSIYASRPF